MPIFTITNNPTAMPRTLLLFATCILCSFNAFTQQQQPLLADTNKGDTAINKLFHNVEIEASFPGGRDGWIAYLRANLNANVPVKKKAKAGTYTVIVRFMVLKDGNIAEVVAETSHGHGMEEEVIRIIKKGPLWKPAEQNGVFVNAYRRQPVTFVVRGR